MHSKVDDPDESKDKSGRYKNVKVDGPSILKSESGRFKNFKVDGLEVTSVDGPYV